MAQATDSPRPQAPSPDEKQHLQQQQQRDPPPTSEKPHRAVNNHSGPGPASEPAFNAAIDPNLESLSTGPHTSLSTATTNTSPSSPPSPAVPSVASEYPQPVVVDAVAGQDSPDGQNGHSGYKGENGEVDVRRKREASDATLSPPPSMSTPQGPHGHQRQMGHYAAPAAYPGVTMPGGQYAYAAAASQLTDPYRGGPAAMNSAMSLPSMRSIDPLQHSQAHAMHMGAPMGIPMGHAPAPIPYYGQPYMHDPNALRFPLQPLVADPRGAMSGGRHKKVEILRRSTTRSLQLADRGAW
jgi:hypothetical protein